MHAADRLGQVAAWRMEVHEPVDFRPLDRDHFAVEFELADIGRRRRPTLLPDSRARRSCGPPAGRRAALVRRSRPIAWSAFRLGRSGTPKRTQRIARVGISSVPPAGQVELGPCPWRPCSSSPAELRTVDQLDPDRRRRSTGGRHRLRALAPASVSSGSVTSPGISFEHDFRASSVGQPTGDRPAVERLRLETAGAASMPTASSSSSHQRSCHVGRPARSLAATISPAVALVGGQLAEVLLDHVAIVGRKILADLLQGFLALACGGRSPQPLLSPIGLLGHVARPSCRRRACCRAAACERLRAPLPGGARRRPRRLAAAFPSLRSACRATRSRRPRPRAPSVPARPRSSRRRMSSIRRAMWSSDSSFSPSRSACISWATEA